ncbi:MAG: hypothetical protein AB8C84_02420 [Oligoflexales bacterium]
MLQQAEGFIKTVLWGMGIQDLAFPLGIIIWFAILSLPIHDLDCEDTMTKAL